MANDDDHRTSDRCDDASTRGQADTDHDSDDELSIPRWAYFGLIAAQMVKRPVFLIPFFGVLLLVLLFGEGVLPRALLPVVFGSFHLLTLCMSAIQSMRNNGVLEHYVSTLLSQTFLGRQYRRRFLNNLK